MTEKMSFFLTLVCLLFLTVSSFSQEKIKVSCSGTSLSTDLSPKAALKEAIQEAKVNALIEAGINEHIGALRVLIKSESESNINQSFSEIITSEVSADIVVDSIYPVKKSFHDEFGYMVVKVRIDATVYKYKEKEDPTFFYSIGHLKDVYYVNESISFTFTPSQKGYLKIFAINENESVLIYPYKHPFAKHLNDDANHCFTAGEEVLFPLHDAYKPGYSIDMAKGKRSESCVLLFVFTKDNFTWVERVTPTDINRRIANITPNRRKVKHFPILLKALNK